MRRWREAWLLAAVAGCSVPAFPPRTSPADVTDVSDLGSDMPVDAVDAGADTSDAISAPEVADAVTVDIAPDADASTPVDTAQEAGPSDVPMDRPADAPVDVRMDVPVDAPVDVSVDVRMDAPMDVPVDTGGDLPTDRAPEVEACSDGGTRCDAACVATGADPTNCGGCGVRCASSAHSMTATCVAGRCRPQCDPGFADCNSNAADGCEADLASASHCGMCGRACAGVRACVRGACVVATPSLGAGDQHTCLRRPDGAVRCWGYNNVGQLGTCSIGGASTSAVPVMMLSDVVGIAIGGGHTCALRSGGALSSWGSGTSGQLGDGMMVSQMCPVGVTGLTDVVQVTAGGEHTCALRASGAISCWGIGASGELGNGMTVTSRTQVSVSGVADALAIDAGGSHTCALRASGEVVCWGANYVGQLGNGTRVGSAVPVAVSGSVSAVAIDAGAGHTCALRASGEVVCWGFNRNGQLGDGTTLDQAAPVSVTGLTDAAQISLGQEHTCARRRSGRVVCWGRGEGGQLGDGASANRITATVDVSGLTDAVEVVAGNNHTCARRATGAVVCWGGNNLGQLGDASMTNRSAPVAVMGL